MGKHGRARGTAARVLALLAVVSCGRAYDAGAEGLLDAEPAKIELSTTFMDFGAAPCGATSATPRAMTIRNNGATALKWSARAAEGTPFSVAPAEGEIAPRESMPVDIVSNAAPPEETPGTKSGVISFSSNDPNAPVVEMVAQRVTTGGMLEIDPQPLSFGSSPVGVAIDAPLTVRNSGNAPLDVAIGASDHAAFTIQTSSSAAPFSAKLEPGAAIEGLVARFTPTAKATTAGSASVTVTGATCGPRPSAITFSGVGSDSTVAVTPASLDFGAIACGQTGATKSVTVLSAPGGPQFDFTALLGKTSSSYFTVAPATGTVGASGAVEVKVTPKTIPTTGGVTPNLYGDQLTISTTAAGDSPHPVSLKMSPVGSMFSLSTGSIDFGDVNTNGDGRERTVVVYNSGNATGTLSFSLSAAAFSIVGATAVTVAPGGSGSIIVRAKPNGTGVKTATIYLSSPNAICAPLPPPISLRCRGQ